jgi:hypothetical protein
MIAARNAWIHPRARMGFRCEVGRPAHRSEIVASATVPVAVALERRKTQNRLLGQLDHLMVGLTEPEFEDGAL